MAKKQEKAPFVEKRMLKQALLEWQQSPRLPMDIVLHNVYKEHGAGSRERKHVSEAAYLAIRYWPTLFPKMDLHLVSPQYLRTLDTVMDTLLVNAEYGKRLARDHEKQKPKFDVDPVTHIREVHGLSETLMNSWNFNDSKIQTSLHSYLHASQTPAPLCVRVNVDRISRDEVIAEFKQYNARPSDFSPLAVMMDRSSPVLRHPMFMEGMLDIQDESSQLLSDIMNPQPGARILDFCAGAGGKTLHLASLLKGTGEVWAYDVEKKKLKVLQQRAKRLGLDNIRIMNAKPPKKEKFDQVLMDVPCSSLGNLRRNPDRIQKIDSWKKLEIQSEIIFDCANYVAPGGLFAYSTCTLRPQENLNKMSSLEDYLREHKGLTPLSVSKHLEKGAERFKGAEFLDAVKKTWGWNLLGANTSHSDPANMLQWTFSSEEEVKNRHLSGAIEGDGFFVALYGR